MKGSIAEGQVLRFIALIVLIVILMVFVGAFIFKVNIIKELISGVLELLYLK